MQQTLPVSVQARAMAAVALLSLLGACASHNVSTTEGFNRLAPGTSVVLMPPDIKYYRVTASGISEPIAEWTTTARQSFDAAFRQFTQTHGIDVAMAEGADVDPLLADYERLHAAVGSTILLNHYGMRPLPAKQERFDWSLGSGVGDLPQVSGHQYALFVRYRDYQAGGGRIGMAIFAAALGASIYAGHQGGFASLVDLSSGDVVWFNNVEAAQGEMRDPDGARHLVAQLFARLATDLER